MPASLATVSAITKEVYGPRIVNQLENEVKLTRRIEKTSEGTTSTAGGKYVTFPLKVRRNTGIGYRNENEQLQAAGQQGHKEVRVPLRYGYGRVRLTGQTMDLVSENYQSFVSAITDEMTGLKDDIKKDTNRILWGNGVGVLATVDTVASSGATTISVGTGRDAIKWLDMDMRVDILSADGSATKVSNALVTGLNKATGDFTISPALTAAGAVGDIVVRTGNFGREPHGLTSLVTDSSAPLFNLSSTDEPLWSSEVDNTGGALSESRMLAMCDRLQENGGRPTVIFSDLGTRRAYFNLLTQQRRFTGTKDFEGGFSGLSFQYDEDIPMVTDTDAPAGIAWFLQEDSFKIYRRNPWDWEDRDGSMWKWVTNYDAYEALMKQYWEFATQRRNVNGKITGITPG